MEKNEELLCQITYEGHRISISDNFELIIDDTIHDKDTSLPFGIPLISTTKLKGKIKRFRNADITVRADLRHTGIGTLITIYADNQKIYSMHYVAPLF